jgi:hypothetical protein
MAGLRPTRILGMKTSLKLSLAVAAMAIVGSNAPVLARGGAASIMNSPGYQRRLQESRQQVSLPDAQPSSAHRGHRSQHRKQH